MLNLYKLKFFILKWKVIIIDISVSYLMITDKLIKIIKLNKLQDIVTNKLTI
jgi:hypothetical protein